MGRSKKGTDTHFEIVKKKSHTTVRIFKKIYQKQKDRLSREHFAHVEDLDAREMH